MDLRQISILQIKITFLLKLNQKIYYNHQLNMILHKLIRKLNNLSFLFRKLKLMIVGMAFSPKADRINL
jgi:hypothetical protein